MLRIGHRGASAYEPENTISSFRRAIEIGVDAVELDVHRTKDGKLIVIHDEDVSRTTDGEGKVGELSLEEVKALEVEGGEEIPTLEEALDFIDGKVKMLVELKESSYEEQVYDLIGEKGLLDNVIIISFDEDALKTMRDLDDDVEIGFIYVRHRKPLDTAVDIGCNYVLPLHHFTHTRTVEEAHERGLKVIVWTVNEVADVEEMREKGVDGIASDKPDILM
ncbi:MAG: glycerophosphodiester phosphodiesterase [Candidatus Bathyarchaeia archaeon]